MNFSFSSRFSRFSRTISLSPLDFQDCVELFLFLLSIFKILYNTFSFSSRFPRFKKIFSSLDIQDFVPCFSSKLGLRCLPLTFVFHLRRNILDGRRNPPANNNGCGWLFVVWSLPRSPFGLPCEDHPHRPESHQHSPSHCPLSSFQMHFRCCLKNHFTGDCSRRNKLFQFSLSTLEIKGKKSIFSFSSRNCRNVIKISLSLLES